MCKLFVRKSKIEKSFYCLIRISRNISVLIYFYHFDVAFSNKYTTFAHRELLTIYQIIYGS